MRDGIPYETTTHEPAPAYAERARCVEKPDPAAARNAELRAHNLGAWRTIHGNDTEEGERRQEATRVMPQCRIVEANR